MAFTQIIKFSVKPESRDLFVAALQEQRQATSRKSGSLAMRIYQDVKDPDLFFAYERWAGEAELTNHQVQEYTQRFIQVAETALADSPTVYTLNDAQPETIEPLQPDPQDPRFNIFFIFKIKPGTREKLLSQFQKHIPPTRTEQGCLMFNLYTVEGNDEMLVVYEHWRKESDVWDIHFNQPYAMATGKVMDECVVGDMQQYMSFVREID